MDNVKQNKEICKRFFDELHDKGNFDIIDELVHPNVISHDPFPGQPKGSEGVRSTMNIFRTAFPDLKLIHNDMIAEDDRVMIKFTATGTHQAKFMNIPATNKKIAYEEVVILRLKDGQITEHWAVADAMALLQQLGIKNF